MIYNLSIIVISFSTLFSCRQYVEKERSNYDYYNIQKADIKERDTLIAVTNENYLQYGVNIAYVNSRSDTVIPFGKYAYFGSDTLTHFAFVIEHPNDSTDGRPLAIDRYQNRLFDVVLFDNGPEEFSEELLRVQRNGKMGFVNKFGEIVIPCSYDYVYNFNDGRAKVAKEARIYFDMDGHKKVESENWVWINKNGNQIN